LKRPIKKDNIDSESQNSSCVDSDKISEIKGKFENEDDDMKELVITV
tara:strand:- start:3610 stop:3750 length:141 start_codon:yes stop_codon:yes gene_type:complete